jgi:hypothetical protein
MVYNHETTWKTMQFVWAQMIACAHKTGGEIFLNNKQKAALNIASVK